MPAELFKFKPHVLKILNTSKFRGRIAVALELGEKRTWDLMKDNSPRLVTKATIKVAMSIMGALDKSDVVEEVNETAEA